MHISYTVQIWQEDSQFVAHAMPLDIMSSGQLIMLKTNNQKMGQVFTTLKLTNNIDEILAERRFISQEEVHSITLDNVLVDPGATRAPVE